MFDLTSNVAQDFCSHIVFPRLLHQYSSKYFFPRIFSQKKYFLESQVKSPTFQINELAPIAQNEFTRMSICNYESNSRALRGNQII